MVLILLVFTGGAQSTLLLHFKQYQLDRILAWIHPYDYVDKISYQQVQGLLAIGSGGLFGRVCMGLKCMFLFVSLIWFYFYRGSLGLCGQCHCCFLYFYLFYQVLVAGLRSNSRFVCTSVSPSFFAGFQTVENIGAVIGLLPLKGIPLPF